ncbi:acyl carrier protein [Mycolicibacterium houstonense]|uniref:acyl carrier protein n=1 Tax=Mycolicibacterium houstonense TaxID=146021 RepID=UPI00083016D0|nr:phosphopantetheine-binding protein [Mycolicibacterium houstonense]MCV7064825.1 acyl carrier protein [Mycolicibacterium farcinogenes]
MSEVREFLIEFITDELELPAEDVNDFSELVGDLGFDSLSFALGVSEIKNRFGVVLNKDDVFECKTVGALVELVENRRLAASGTAGNPPGQP